MAAGDPASKRATYADVLAAPEHVVAEIVDGVLYTNPRPAIRHAGASSALGAQLGGPFQLGRGGPGGWVFLDEPELHFDDDVLVPDLAAWRRDRWDARFLEQAYLTIAPDWLCEVLSPSTARLDRMRKLPVYRRAGTKHVWLVDALARTVEVFRAEADGWKLVDTQSEGLVRLEPFADVEIELGHLWEP